ncbi:MAG: hypothetical protein JNM88_07725 [Chitinophagaceae bacterium]|nr:hypothetical protein [Chitinophagaceae bacterium]
MKKAIFLAAISGIILLLGCPGKKDGATAGKDCGCRSEKDSNSICASFVSGRCGWCAEDTCQQGDLCSYLPRDVDFYQKQAGYSTFIPACQNAFDWFSWQSFVALNWPADADGNPLKVPINEAPNAPRVWEAYLTLPEVFDGAAKNNSGFMMLGQNTKAGPHQFDGNIDDMEPGSDKPLIDRNLNFTLYEVRVNKTEADFIQKHGLTTWCGQKKFYDSVSRAVQFPSGSYESGEVGSIELKLAWRIMVPGVDDTTRFFTRKAIIVVPAANVVTKVAIRDTVTVGLVGMHLVRNVKTKGTSWIWSSFEQIDNSPECPNGNCPAGAAIYSFYNPGCTGCNLNTPPSATGNNFLWSVSQGNSRQYGRQYALNGYGSQIGRINPVEASTDSISTLWRNKLKAVKSVWQYYRLIGSQWLNAEDSRGPSNTFGIPPAQANTAMESYLQILKPGTGSGSCMNCHGFATGSYQNLNANLSFTLGYPPADSLNCITGKK